DRIRRLAILSDGPAVSIVIGVTGKRDLTSGGITDSISCVIEVEDKRPGCHPSGPSTTNGDEDLDPENTSVIFEEVKIW
ncbi:hypothetical protein CTAM01_17195, partial [Colletotrichum tamarilloi]